MTLARYAVIDAAGDVQNTVMWDGEAEYDPGEGLTLEVIQDGWGVVDGKLVEISSAAPAPPPAIDLKAYAASARDARETAGITVGGIEVDTSLESQNRIANAWVLMQASGATSISYKSTTGFSTLTTDQFKTLALAVGAHVQTCFAIEAAIDAALDTTPPTITMTAQIDALFVTSEQ